MGEEEIKNIKSIFNDLDDNTIRRALEVNHFDSEQTINYLLNSAPEVQENGDEFGENDQKDNGGENSEEFGGDIEEFGGDNIESNEGDFGGFDNDEFDYYQNDLVEDDEDDINLNKEVDDPQIILENMYLEAKDSEQKIKSDENLNDFNNVIQTELSSTGQNGKWGFKSLKWIIKINYNLKRHDVVRSHLMILLDKYALFLIENDRDMNKIFDHVNESPFIKELYNITLKKFDDIGNKKTSLRLELRLAKVLLKRQEYIELDQLLDTIYNRCKLENGEEDPTKGNQLIEYYSMKIERYLRDNNPNFKSLKSLYQRASSLKGLCSPKNLGIIYECGGKIFLVEKNFKDSNTDFIEAFRGYDLAGLRQLAIQCLKYLILSNMLSNSPVNPFDEQRAKSYQQSPEIESMLNLIDSYRNRQITNFERVLKKNSKDLMSDPFISDYIQELRKKLRSHVLKSLIRPYKNISLSYITSELQVSEKEAEALLVELLLDNEIVGKIDQIHRLLLLKSDKSSITPYAGLTKWVNNLTSLEKSTTSKVQ